MAEEGTGNRSDVSGLQGANEQENALEAGSADSSSQLKSDGKISGDKGKQSILMFSRSAETVGNSGADQKQPGQRPDRLHARRPSTSRRRGSSEQNQAGLRRAASKSGHRALKAAQIRTSKSCTKECEILRVDYASDYSAGYSIMYEELLPNEESTTFAGIGEESEDYEQEDVTLSESTALAIDLDAKSDISISSQEDASPDLASGKSVHKNDYERPGNSPFSQKKASSINSDECLDSANGYSESGVHKSTKNPCTRNESPVCANGVESSHNWDTWNEGSEDVQESCSSSEESERLYLKNEQDDVNGTVSPSQLGTNIPLNESVAKRDSTCGAVSQVSGSNSRTGTYAKQGSEYPMESPARISHDDVKNASHHPRAANNCDDLQLSEPSSQAFVTDSRCLIKEEHLDAAQISRIPASPTSQINLKNTVLKDKEQNAGISPPSDNGIHVIKSVHGVFPSGTNSHANIAHDNTSPLLECRQEDILCQNSPYLERRGSNKKRAPYPETIAKAITDAIESGHLQASRLVEENGRSEYSVTRASNCEASLYENSGERLDPVNETVQELCLLTNKKKENVRDDHPGVSFLSLNSTKEQSEMHSRREHNDACHGDKLLHVYPSSQSAISSYSTTSEHHIVVNSPVGSQSIDHKSGERTAGNTSKHSEANINVDIRTSALYSGCKSCKTEENHDTGAHSISQECIQNDQDQVILCNRSESASSVPKLVKECGKELDLKECSCDGIRNQELEINKDLGREDNSCELVEASGLSTQINDGSNKVVLVPMVMSARRSLVKFSVPSLGTHEYLPFLDKLRKDAAMKREANRQQTKANKHQRKPPESAKKNTPSSEDDFHGDTESLASTPICPIGREVPPDWKPGEHSSHPLTKLTACYNSSRKVRKQRRPTRKKNRTQSRMFTRKKGNEIGSSKEVDRHLSIFELNSKMQKSHSQLKKSSSAMHSFDTGSTDTDCAPGVRTGTCQEQISGSFEYKRRYYERMSEVMRTADTAKRDNMNQVGPAPKRVTSQVRLLKTLDELYSPPSSDEAEGEAMLTDPSFFDINHQTSLFNYCTTRLQHLSVFGKIPRQEPTTSTMPFIRIRKATQEMPSALDYKRLRSLYDSQTRKSILTSKTRKVDSAEQSILDEKQFSVVKSGQEICPMKGYSRADGRKQFSPRRACVNIHTPEISAMFDDIEEPCAKEFETSIEKPLTVRSSAEAVPIKLQHTSYLDILKANLRNSSRDLKETTDSSNQQTERSNARLFKSSGAESTLVKDIRRFPCNEEYVTDQASSPKDTLGASRNKMRVSFADPWCPASEERSALDMSNEDAWCSTVNTMLLRANRIRDGSVKNDHRYPKPDSARVVSPVPPKSPTFLKELLKQDTIERKQAKGQIKLERKFRETVLKHEKQDPRPSRLPTPSQSSLPAPSTFMIVQPRVEESPATTNSSLVYTVPAKEGTQQVNMNEKSAGVLKISIQMSKRAQERAWLTHERLKRQRSSTSDQEFPFEMKTLPKKLAPLRISKPINFENPNNGSMERVPMRDILSRTLNGNSSSPQQLFQLRSVPEESCPYKSSSYLPDQQGETSHYYREPYMHHRSTSIVPLFSDSNNNACKKDGHLFSDSNNNAYKKDGSLFTDSNNNAYKKDDLLLTDSNNNAYKKDDLLCSDSNNNAYKKDDLLFTDSNNNAYKKDDQLFTDSNNNAYKKDDQLFTDSNNNAYKKDDQLFTDSNNNAYKKDDQLFTDSNNNAYKKDDQLLTDSNNNAYKKDDLLCSDSNNNAYKKNDQLFTDSNNNAYKKDVTDEGHHSVDDTFENYSGSEASNETTNGNQDDFFCLRDERPTVSEHGNSSRSHGDLAAFGFQLDRSRNTDYDAHHQVSRSFNTKLDSHCTVDSSLLASYEEVEEIPHIVSTSKKDTEDTVICSISTDKPNFLMFSRLSNHTAELVRHNMSDTPQQSQEENGELLESVNQNSNAPPTTNKANKSQLDYLPATQCSRGRADQKEINSCNRQKDEGQGTTDSNGESTLLEALLGYEMKTMSKTPIRKQSSINEQKQTLTDCVEKAEEAYRTAVRGDNVSVPYGTLYLNKWVPSYAENVQVMEKLPDEPQPQKDELHENKKVHENIKETIQESRSQCSQDLDAVDFARYLQNLGPGQEMTSLEEARVQNDFARKVRRYQRTETAPVALGSITHFGIEGTTMALNYKNMAKIPHDCRKCQKKTPSTRNQNKHRNPTNMHNSTHKKKSSIPRSYSVNQSNMKANKICQNGVASSVRCTTSKKSVTDTTKKDEKRIEKLPEVTKDVTKKNSESDFTLYENVFKNFNKEYWCLNKTEDRCFNWAKVKVPPTFSKNKNNCPATNSHESFTWTDAFHAASLNSNYSGSPDSHRQEKDESIGESEPEDVSPCVSSSNIRWDITPNNVDSIRDPPNSLCTTINIKDASSACIDDVKEPKPGNRYSSSIQETELTRLEVQRDTSLNCRPFNRTSLVPGGINGIGVEDHRDASSVELSESASDECDTTSQISDAFIEDKHQYINGMRQSEEDENETVFAMDDSKEDENMAVFGTGQGDKDKQYAYYDTGQGYEGENAAVFGTGQGDKDKQDAFFDTGQGYEDESAAVFDTSQGANIKKDSFFHVDQDDKDEGRSILKRHDDTWSTTTGSTTSKNPSVQDLHAEPANTTAWHKVSENLQLDHICSFQRPLFKTASIIPQTICAQTMNRNKPKNQKLHADIMDRTFLKSLRSTDLIRTVSLDRGRLLKSLQLMTRRTGYLPVFQIKAGKSIEMMPLVVSLYHCAKTFIERGSSSLSDSLRSLPVFYTEDEREFITSIYTVNWIPEGVYSLEKTDLESLPMEDSTECASERANFGKLVQYSPVASDLAFGRDRAYLIGDEVSTREEALKILVSDHDEARGDVAKYFLLTCGWVPPHMMMTQSATPSETPNCEISRDDTEHLTSSLNMLDCKERHRDESPHLPIISSGAQSQRLEEKSPEFTHDKTFTLPKISSDRPSVPLTIKSIKNSALDRGTVDKVCSLPFICKSAGMIAPVEMKPNLVLCLRCGVTVECVQALSKEDKDRKEILPKRNYETAAKEVMDDTFKKPSDKINQTRHDRVNCYYRWAVSDLGVAVPLQTKVTVKPAFKDRKSLSKRKPNASPVMQTGNNIPWKRKTQSLTTFPPRNTAEESHSSRPHIKSQPNISTKCSLLKYQATPESRKGHLTEYVYPKTQPQSGDNKDTRKNQVSPCSLSNTKEDNDIPEAVPEEKSLTQEYFTHDKGPEEIVKAQQTIPLNNSQQRHAQKTAVTAQNSLLSMFSNQIPVKQPALQTTSSTQQPDKVKPAIIDPFVAGWSCSGARDVAEDEKDLMEKRTWTQPVIPPPFPSNPPANTTPLKQSQKSLTSIQLSRAHLAKHRRNLTQISHSYVSPYWAKKEIKRARSKTPASDSDGSHSSISRITTISGMSSASSESNTEEESSTEDSESDSGSSATGSDFFTRYANKGGPTSVDDIFKRTLPKQRLSYRLNLIKEAKEKEEIEQLGYLRGREGATPPPRDQGDNVKDTIREVALDMSEYDMCSDAEEMKELWKLCFPEVDFWDRNRRKKFKKRKILF